MKIIHVIWAFPHAGAETMLVDIINIQSLKNRVFIIIINKNYNKSLLSKINKNVEIIKLNRNSSSINPLPFFLLNFWLFKKKPDIIHCHNYTIGKLLFRIFLKKTVLTVHGFKRPLNKNHVYRKVIAISNAVKNDLILKGLSNVELVTNGIFPDKISKKQSFNKKISIACIGRLDINVKGQDILLGAFVELVKNNSDLTLHFYGEGLSKNILINKVDEQNLKSCVFFHGLLNREEIYQAISNHDIIVQPSIHEGFGLSAIEAMAAKVPLVISGAKGLLEVTNYGELVFGVSHKNKSEDYIKIISNLIVKIKENDLTLKKKINLASNYVKNHFAIQITCNNYNKIYREISLK